MVTASNGSQTVTRNSSHFKAIPKHFAHSQENDVHAKKDDEKTPGIQQNPSDTKEEESLPRRSNRPVKPPIRFSDYIRVIYGKQAEARNFSDAFIHHAWEFFFKIGPSLNNF